MAKAETIDVSYVLKFTWTWFKSLDNAFGMTLYAKDKGSSAAAGRLNVAAAATTPSTGESNILVSVFFYCRLSHSPFDCLLLLCQVRGMCNSFDKIGHQALFHRDLPVPAANSQQQAAPLAERL